MIECTDSAAMSSIGQDDYPRAHLLVTFCVNVVPCASMLMQRHGMVVVSDRTPKPLLSKGICELLAYVGPGLDLSSPCHGCDSSHERVPRTATSLPDD